MRREGARRRQHHLQLSSPPSPPQVSPLSSSPLSFFRVADAHHFNADPDPAFHFNADPNPDPAPH
jgi:hypothetical protein